jgi:hypothetical protein
MSLLFSLETETSHAYVDDTFTSMMVLKIRQRNDPVYFVIRLLFIPK